MITTIPDSIKEQINAQQKSQEEEQPRGHGSSVNRRESGRAHGINHDLPPVGGNYSFSLDDESVRNKIYSEDDNTLLYAILAGIGVVGVAFLTKKNKKKKKKK